MSEYSIIEYPFCWRLMRFIVLAGASTYAPVQRAIMRGYSFNFLDTAQMLTTFLCKNHAGIGREDVPVEWDALALWQRRVKRPTLKQEPTSV